MKPDCPISSEGTAMSTINSPVLIFAVSALLLSGCASAPPAAPIYKTVLIAPDDNLLGDCTVGAPPGQEAYKAASMKQREEMLVDVIDKGYRNAFLCNERWQKVRQWKLLEMKNYQQGG
ncbi:hypothetical protein [Rugamonas aquatica]|nr:hypothetical protein [Rugamonas aquatica]